MADLSNLLGAVYGDEATTPERDPDGPPVPEEKSAAERGPAVPDWADDDHLDAAFGQWRPGPPADAPEAERELVAGEPGPPAPLADDLAAALSEALVATTQGDVIEEDEDDSADEVDDTGSFTPMRAAAVEQDQDDADDEADDRPSFTPMRAAAVELAATSRHEPAPVVSAIPSPAPVPEPAADTTPAPVEEPATVPVPALDGPAVTRHWDRSDDDILPTNGGKKFFSLSLRRG